jgi:hypothetical protein
MKSLSEYLKNSWAIRTENNRLLIFERASEKMIHDQAQDGLPVDNINNENLSFLPLSCLFHESSKESFSNSRRHISS